jgi:hypothetical protein
MNRLIFSAACIAALRAAPALAQQEPVQTPEPQLLLRYEEQSLSDADLAKIVEAVAGSLDVADWTEVTALPGETVRGLIDRFYDIYAKSGGVLWRPLPATAEKLAQIIVSANELPTEQLKDGQTVRLPPPFEDRRP